MLLNWKGGRRLIVPLVVICCIVIYITLIFILVWVSGTANGFGNRTELLRKLFRDDENKSNPYPPEYLGVRKKLLRIRTNLSLVDFDGTLKQALGLEEVLIGLEKDEIERCSEKATRSVLVSTWRSGSSFLAEVVRSHPSVFYSYEPLFYLQVKRANSPAEIGEGVDTINDLMECNFPANYIHGTLHFTSLQNPRLEKFCEQNRTLFCENEGFLSRFCNVFPHRFIKTVRLRLPFVSNIMKGGTTTTGEVGNVRIVYLVRDPRGTMASRLNPSVEIWCNQDNKDCSDPVRLCQDLVDDYYAAKELQREYPDNILVIRYEDFSLNPKVSTQKLMSFLGLCPDHPEVVEFLKTHTSSSKGAEHSTYRDSRKTVFKWLDYYSENGINGTKKLSQVQDSCEVAMKLWGYQMIPIKVDEGDQGFNILPSLLRDDFQFK